MNNLRFKREGSKVELWGFTSILDSTKHLVFERDFGTEMLAEYVLRDLIARLGKTLFEVRQEAYNKGYKDARVKRAKDRWFDDRLELP